MSNYEYHQQYMAAMKKLAGNSEHKDWCNHWKGSDCNCDPDISAEDAPPHKKES